MKILVSYFRVLLLLAVALSQAGESYAHQASAQLDPGHIRIGEHASLLLDIRVPAEGELTWPPLSELFSEDIELIRANKADTLSLDADSLHIYKSLVITSWEEGYYPIPPIRLKHIVNQDTTVFKTSAILLEVEDVEVDLEEDIKDIRPLINIPLRFREVLPWVILGIALAVVLFLAYKIWKKRAGRETHGPFSKPKEAVPAHIAAISRLETLRKRKIWQDGHIKQHHMELTDIIRTYISKRYGFAAQEMTTSEILRIMNSQIQEERMWDILTEILQQADLVKFAKHKPEDDEHEKAIDKALKFVTGTVPEETSHSKGG